MRPNLPPDLQRILQPEKRTPVMEAKHPLWPRQRTHHRVRHSSRIESTIARKSDFETDLEYQTAHSKVHWSELSSEYTSNCVGSSGSEESVVDHHQYIEKLQKERMHIYWGSFCSKVVVVLGKRLAEGAQANVYEAQVTFADEVRDEDDWIGKRPQYVVKVMKGDSALEDLQRQLPHGVASLGEVVLLALNGALVKELATERSKFGFIMERDWGDL